MSKYCDCNKHTDHSQCDETCSCHHHDHNHQHHHEEENKTVIIVRMVISVLLWAVSNFILKDNFQFVGFVLAYIIVGYDVIISAIKGLLHLEWTNEQFLMTFASLISIFVSEAEEAVMVMLLYQLGEFLSDLAVDHSKDSILDLLNNHQSIAHKVDDGQVIDINLNEVEVGMLLQVKPFEEIPVDGIVDKGETLLDLSSINGESLPVAVKKNDEVLSGTINLNNMIIIKATKTIEDSTITKIKELIQECEMEKSKTESIVDKFARYYTPIVILLAILTAVLVPLFSEKTFVEAIKMAATLLVISCPCALVISVPLAFFCGIGNASRNGVLVKGAQYIEMLNKIDYLALDKTGTLTTGDFELTDILGDNSNLEIAAHIEENSNHPLAKAIVKAYPGKIDVSKVSDIDETSGKGVTGKYNGQVYHIGSENYIKSFKIKPKYTTGKTVIYLANDKECLNAFVLSDEIKKGAREALRDLRLKGVSRIDILSGDLQENVEQLTKSLPIDNAYGQLLPDGKVEYLRSVKENNFNVAFVGDGSNDAAVLSMADVGIGMGIKGTDLAIASSDVVVMTDDLRSLIKGIKIANKTIKLVKENIIFIIGCKLLFIILSLCGFSNMWLAVFADVGVTLITVLNSTRAAKNIK